jgi:hypothetical protein
MGRDSIDGATECQIAGFDKWNCLVRVPFVDYGRVVPVGVDPGSHQRLDHRKVYDPTDLIESARLDRNFSYVAMPMIGCAFTFMIGNTVHAVPFETANDDVRLLGHSQPFDKAFNSAVLDSTLNPRGHEE